MTLLPEVKARTFSDISFFCNETKIWLTPIYFNLTCRIGAINITTSTSRCGVITMFPTKPLIMEIWGYCGIFDYIQSFTALFLVGNDTCTMMSHLVPSRQASLCCLHHVWKRINSKIFPLVLHTFPIKTRSTKWITSSKRFFLQYLISHYLYLICA